MNFVIRVQNLNEVVCISLSAKTKIKNEAKSRTIVEEFDAQKIRDKRGNGATNRRTKDEWEEERYYTYVLLE